MPIGETVGGAFLSAFLQVLFDRLASPEFANFIRVNKVVHKKLRRLEATLKRAEFVLDDAEKKQIRDPKVDTWLNDLKDAVYVADDLLDEIFIKAATQKQEVSYLSSLLNFQDREMARKLEPIVDRLESILEIKESLDLEEIAVENSSVRTPSTSLQDEAHVYGRDKDKEAIKRLLLDDNEQVSVIPIVGMGGVGKTTLAQLVYNDDTSKDFFKAWVSVFDEFDIVKVTKRITEAVTGKASEMNDLNLLHLNLQDKLKEKKFLVVLDDFCIENYSNWNHLKKCFQLGVRGSKILVTTRSQNVASLVGTVQTYHLDYLSQEDCWQIFANHACFSPGSGDNTAALEKIGREIVKKCAGLPLAAQSLGGILQRTHDIKDWKNLLKNNIWELSENESGIIPALRVSYLYLPPELKRCFVYCSLFPKGYSFEKDELVLLWIAEGIISPPSERKTLEEVGGAYFDYLVARSFLKPSIVGWEFGMHDLLHDLAIFLGGEFYFRPETKISMKTRHLSFTDFNHLLEKYEDLGAAKYLRTLLLPMNSPFRYLRTLMPMNYPFKLVDDGEEACILLSKLKHLRVLYINLFYRLNALPDSIGEMIHLRYLNLSYTGITTLPESLGNLFHLQTLILSGCVKLNMLPSSMENLINLLWLDISGTFLEEMPQGMRKLTQLRYLSDYIVGKNEGNGIKELGGVLNLEGSLSITKLENVSNGSEALEAKMVDKKYIKFLSLTWSSADSCLGSQMEMDIICNLQPHEDLEHLKIKGYRGTRFPDWVGNPSYGNMTNLTLISCKSCWKLPSLGQLPTLKYLSISDFDVLRIIDDGFYKNDDSSMLMTPFPFLETLEIKGMPYWEVWSSTDSCAFPKLKRLKIVNCPKLKGDLPSQLPALVTLYVERCKELACSLPRASSEGDCLPISLETLSILDSTRLEFPKKQIHKSLVSLSITSSDSLTCLPLETFPNLQSLHVRNCKNLEYLSEPQDCVLRNLESLYIDACPKFVSFPREGLHAPSLTHLSIYHCEKLNSWPQQMNILLPKLKHLTVSHCPGIASFPEGGMPPSLESIGIMNCEKLLSGPAWPSMEMLTKVSLYGPHDGIKSFPKEGLLPSSLVSLHLCNFQSLETLDCKGLLHLTSLKSLSIYDCPKLENIAGESSLPASLLEILPNIRLQVKENKKREIERGKWRGSSSVNE